MQIIKSHKSPHHSSREGYKVKAIVLHITEGSAASAMSWFMNPRSQVSSHYIVAPYKPYIMQIVPEDRAAWHAGRVVKPTWPGLIKTPARGGHANPNKYTIGIEVALPNWHAMPTWGQWTAVVRLVRDIANRHSITLDINGLVNHNEINGLKLCPGRWITRWYILALMKFIK